MTDGRPGRMIAPPSPAIHDPSYNAMGASAKVECGGVRPGAFAGWFRPYWAAALTKASSKNFDIGGTGALKSPSSTNPPVICL
jgi:hypothetical protein